jgi:hypothetical protein
MSRGGRLLSSPSLHWSVLGVLLAFLLVGAATFDRSAWPSVVGDEATYLMQAESLAWDGDLVYSRADFDRFVAHWGERPEGLILQKGESSDRLAYGKPFFYALWSAPFTRVSPTRGPFVGNVVLLAFAAIGAALALRRTVGPAAPTWAALFVFASVAFAYAFWAHLDLFLMCLAALGLALVFGGAPEASDPPRARAALRWLGAGALLAAVAYSRPFYLSLFLPAVLAILSGRSRRSARAALLLAGGALLLCLATLAVQETLAGSWTSYGAQRRSFYTATGYPEVDFPVATWDEMIARFGNAAWLKQHDIAGINPGTPRLWAWNLLYLAAGQSVGIVPYLLPGLLGLLTWWGRPPGAARWTLLVAVAATAFGFFVLRPHNFYGGGASLGNRYLLPVYPALWFLPTRPLKPAWLLVTAAVAAPFLWPLWTAPRAFPLDPQGAFRYVSRAAWDLLPYETTQNHLKPGGAQPDVEHHGLWLKPLTPSVRVGTGVGPLHLETGLGPGELLVGADHALERLDLVIETGAPEVRIGGARVIGEDDRGAGRRRLRLELERPRARHPMWWTPEDFYLYWLRVEPAGGDAEATAAFSLRPGA